MKASDEAEIERRAKEAAHGPLGIAFATHVVECPTCLAATEATPHPDGTLGDYVGLCREGMALLARFDADILAQTRRS